MEYEGRNKVITQEELGIAYKFDINGGTTVESKNTLNRENSYYLLEDYFFEEIDNDDEFFHSFYENPSAYLNGKKMKIRYLKSNPQKNILNLFYEEKNVWADIVLYSFTFLMILAVLLGITQTLSNNKQ
ncbi:MAG: hypothetical protein EAS52_15165 [Parapedobacter sp.]|nr:MAG: hypothetical protein EAS52_15165 [Parapedobacter sp.]